MGENDRDTVDLFNVFTYLFNRVLGMEPKSAQYASYYYITYIQKSPTNFTDMLKTISEIAPKSSRSSLLSSRNDLLAKGLIAQILPNVDCELGRETYIPVRPKVLWDLYKNDLADQSSHAEDIVNKLSDIYDKKFSLAKTKQKILTISKNNGCYLPLCYSGNWVLYIILSYAKKGNDLFWILSGSRYDRYSFFKDMILQKGVNIKAIFNIKGKSMMPQVTNEVSSDLKDYGNLGIQYMPLSDYSTSRITILNGIFALDGKRILPICRTEPAYIGLLYLNKDDIETLSNGFITVWGLLNNYNDKT